MIKRKLQYLGGISNMNQGLVSVVIICNNPKYLVQTIESINNQDYNKNKLEIILVLDRLNTTEISNLLSNKTQIKLKILQSKNPGVMEATNLAIEVAEGEFIAIIDSDDEMIPDRISKQIEFLDKNKEVCAVGGHINLIDASGTKFGVKKYKLSNKSIRQNIFEMAQLAHPATTYRRREVIKIGGYRDVDALDIDLWIRFLEYFAISNLDYEVINYRVHPDNYSKKDIFKTNIPRLVIWVSHFLRIQGLHHELPRKGEELEWIYQNRKFVKSSFVTRLALSENWNMSPQFMHTLHKYKTTKTPKRFLILLQILSRHKEEFVKRFSLKIRRILYIKFLYKTHRWAKPLN
jgi:glycosyltransferase involved in cell wall biosynthesis